MDGSVSLEIKSPEDCIVPVYESLDVCWVESVDDAALAEDDEWSEANEELVEYCEVANSVVVLVWLDINSCADEDNVSVVVVAAVDEEIESLVTVEEEVLVMNSPVDDDDDDTLDEDVPVVKASNAVLESADEDEAPVDEENKVFESIELDVPVDE